MLDARPYFSLKKNTPLGTLVVKFYQVEPYGEEAFERLRLRDFWLHGPGFW